LIWRIRERDAFARLGREGFRIRTSSLWCTYLPDPAAVPPRVAFAIGRAVGPAVVRNRLRRRLRALLASSLELPPGWYLIGARPVVTERTFDQLRSELTVLVAKASNRTTNRTSTSSTTTPTVPSAP
jgi:ribonuclease P protein component